MLIAPAAGSESAKAPDDGAFDVALVVVHGMGNAFKSQILLEWAEPLLERMDWVARDRIIGADESHGVTIHDSDLSGDTPVVTATVRFPKRRDPAAPDAPPETVERRIAILEARWSESFVPMTRAQVFRWAVPFMWRVITRTLDLFWNTMVVLSALTLGHHLRAPRQALLLPRTMNFLVDGIRLLVNTIAFAVVWLFLVLLGVVLTPILPLLSPLLLIPWFKNIAQGVLDGLVESIGDVASWKERPVRASAMRLVVRDALAHAKQLVGDDGEVHLFAHSQGAAVATFALFEELEPKSFNVRRLTTVGAAVVLLGREKWQGRKDEYTPVKTWIERNRDAAPEDRVAWANHWAIWDPFSAGPIADTPADARKRWQAAYFPSDETLALGPEEHAVHNTSQPWLDHGVYYANTVQVVEPTVRHLLGPDFPTVAAPVDYIRNRLVVIDKKSLGLSTIAALFIAAMLPGLSGMSAVFAWLITTIAGAIGSAIALVPGLDGSAASASVAFLIDDDADPPRLTVIGWVIASALLAALLIWLNQLMQKQTERSIVWDRCPLDVRTWLVLTAVPRALYVIGAAVVVWFAILDWWEPQPDAASLAIDAALLAIVAAFVIVEPRFSPAPRVVPEQRTLDDRATVLPPTERMRLGVAIASQEYQAELAARRARLQPDGPWATWWAKHFHGWTPGQQPPGA
ncbi:hypothetical protein J2X63_002213 [Agromyces sp. 3263]|uniref:hypothetical protein n=1 Tax=Agromyces sp. 3263 TaxID=2817750 RepID=UPI00285ED60B|nr:hypothetical protein [Agromyces sp. 3263]MDR6906527.1 hypothetical protein [Agromyces sp. 3263]